MSEQQKNPHATPSNALQNETHKRGEKVTPQTGRNIMTTKPTNLNPNKANNQSDKSEEKVTGETFLISVTCRDCGQKLSPHTIKEHFNAEHPIHECPHDIKPEYVIVRRRLESLQDLRSVWESLNQIGDPEELQERLPCQSCLEKTVELLDEIGDLDVLNMHLPRLQYLEQVRETLDGLGDLETLNRLLPEPAHLETISDGLTAIGDLDDLNRNLPTPESLEAIENRISDLGDLDDLSAKLGDVISKLERIIELRDAAGE